MQQLNSKRPPQLSINKNFIDNLKEQQKQSKTIVNQKQDNSISLIKQSPSPSELDSPRRRKFNEKSQKKVSQIQVAHKELITYIDLLDDRVYKLIQKHEAQFLVAYRNHVKKIRQEMVQIKQKAQSNASSTISQTQKIQSLEKQLSLFRQESLKLFQKVNQKQKTINNLKIQLNELEAQKQLLERTLRSVTRRNKQLEVFKYEEQNKKSNSQFNKQFLVSRPIQHESINEQMNTPYVTEMNKTGLSFKSRQITTAINSKMISLRSRDNSMHFHKKNSLSEFMQCKQQIQSKVNEVLIGKVHQKTIQKLKQNLLEVMRPKQSLFMSINTNKLSDTPIIKIKKETRSLKQIELKKRNRSFFENKTQSRKNQLQQYFQRSIETVRKEIARRKGLKSINFYSQYTGLSLEEFKKVDLFRLMELLVSHDKIVETVHSAIFQTEKFIK